MLTHGGDADDFLEHAKMEMYRTHVFAFTPNGRLVLLPAGINAARLCLCRSYSDRRHLRWGTRINGVPRNTFAPRCKMVTSSKLSAATDPRPLPGYETLCVTGRARAAQTQSLRREQESQQFANLGRNLLERALRQNQLDPVSA